MDWYEASEKVVGLIWTGRRMASAYPADVFAPPYDEVIKILQKKGGSKENVLKKVNDKYIQGAIHSVAHLNGLGDEKTFDDVLIKAAEYYKLGDKFEKMGRALKANETVELLPIHGQLTSIVAGQSTGLTAAKNIDYKKYKPFQKSGHPAIDKVLGGIPADGPIVAYGVQGVGKSHFSECLALGQVSYYPQKTVGIYTLEMSAEHYLWRAIKMYPDLQKYLDRIYVSGSIHTVNDLISEVQSKRLDFVVLDDMDRLVKSASADEYQKTYLQLADICRFLKIPVLILAQPNREAKWAIERGERFLSQYDISWSGGAENAAAMQIGLQRASALDMITRDTQGHPIDTMFPLEDEKREFLIFWKSRDGWPGDYEKGGQFGPGAIRLEPKLNSRMWMGEPYQNKLWKPNASKTAIGNGKSRR